jgi:N-acetylglucosamine-6-phosphate deacetylase
MNKPGKKVVFSNGCVLTDTGFREDLDVIVTDGRVTELRPFSGIHHTDVDRVDLGGDYLVPGFIDVQVNGGGGVLFNDAPNVNGVRTIAEAHRKFGTTGLLPTLISDDLDVIEAGLDAVDEAIKTGVPGVLGIHIEGPFLCPQRRGIHEAGKMRRLNSETLESLHPLKNGVTVMTVAPEAVEPGMIRELTRRGFLVCAGHSDANRSLVADALRQGLRGFTHLFNAMSQLAPREPGMVGTALADPESWCGVIADGIHLADEALRIAWLCKGAAKLMLVTDAMPPVGTDDREFSLQGKKINVVEGICSYSDGTLAGAVLDMNTAVRYVREHIPCSIEDAIRMATSSPAAFLDLKEHKGRIAPGMDADFCIIDSDLRVVNTVIGGDLR